MLNCFVLKHVQFLLLYFHDFFSSTCPRISSIYPFLNTNNCTMNPFLCQYFFRQFNKTLWTSFKIISAANVVSTFPSSCHPVGLFRLSLDSVGSLSLAIPVA